MKLTKKLLAVVLAVAMLLGMVAVGATASITDYYEYDAKNNPYQAKIGLKAYKVDTSDGTYTEITDGAVNAGDVVRVEIWAQTNFYTSTGQFAVMYKNNIFQSTDLEYNVYDYYARPASTTYAKVFAMVPYDQDHFDEVSATDGPYRLNEAVKNATAGFNGKTSAMNFANVKKHMPKSWQGTGNTATTYYKSETEALDYNYYMCAYQPDTNYEFAPYAGVHVILTEYQPVLYFHLTVPADAADGTTGDVRIDAETVASSALTGGSTFMARSYSSDFSSEQAAIDSGLTYIANTTSMQKYKDTYDGDSNTYDRQIDLTNAKLTLTVGGAGTGPVDPPVTVNKDALKIAIDTLPAVDKANATSASWADYEAALATANEVYANDAADQTAVDEATAALVAATAAVKALGKCDYSKLTSAKAAYTALNEADYTPNSWTTSGVEAAYAAANAIAADLVADEAGANQKKIDDAAAALTAAIDKLVEKADKAALDAAIATSVSTANCPAAAVEAYNNALATAQSVSEDPNATQTAVDEAKDALLAAIAGLVPLGNCNYAALDAAIAAYDELTLADYTPASVTESGVEAAYAAAKAVERDMVADEAGANQKKIDDAATALDTAVKALVKKAEKAALKAAIDTVVDTENCTSASVAAYTEAKAEAEDVFADPNASQDAVNAAADKLTTAIANVKKLDKCDYEALNAAIAAYDALTLDNYTPASVKSSDVVALYAAAKAVEADMFADEAGANQAKINAAATALDAAIKSLVEKADKDALNVAINTVVDTTDCTSDSIAAYEKALAEARAVAADEDATQEAVNLATVALNAAINGLKGLGTCDYSKLDAAKAAYVALVKDNYKPASWTASGVDAAYEAANAIAADLVADEAGTNQAMINAAADALTEAIGKLEEKADKVALAAAIADAKTYVEADYTPDSWAAADLVNVIEAAELVNANADASDEDVAAAIASLSAAVDKLQTKADKAALAAAITAAEEFTADAYTPDSWAAADLTTVIEAAKVVLNDDNADAAAVAAAIASLSAAADKLVEKADKTALEAAIATVPEVSEANATADSWKAYTDTKAVAEEVFADANASNEAVQTATNNLLAAIAGVKAAPCDYAALDAAIAAYDELVLADYVDTAAATAAYEAAKAIASDLTKDEEGANQKAIDDAAAVLDAAVKALQKKADKDALVAAIAAVPAYDEETATEATWADYAAALAKANEVNDDVAATQEAVDEAAAALVAATAALASRELCDYAALDAALALTPAEEQNKYTAASWKAYADAKAVAEAVAKDLVNDKSGKNQAAINAAAAALTEAFNALKVSEAAVTKVDVDLSEYYSKASKDYAFTVTGAPSKLQIIGPTGSTLTYDRYNRNVVIVSYNADGEVVDYKNEAPAYEVWTLPLSLGEGEFKVRAKFGSKWEGFTNEFTVEFADNAADEVKFVAKEAGTDAEASKALVMAKGGTAEITVVAPDTADKVQFVFASGSTSTYAKTSAGVVVTDNGDGTNTWTITRLFKSAGTGSITLKLRDAAGWYAANTAIITTEITK